MAFIYRWFTELNSMVELSMANCECHNQRVRIQYMKPYGSIGVKTDPGP